MKFLFIVFVSLIGILFPETVFADNENRFVTIVNPVRISFYTKDLNKNLEVQNGVLKRLNLPATWLLSYDVLTQEKALETIRSFDSNQELGLFLEITPDLATNAEVEYNRTASWHYATSVFLSGYNQEDRIKIIDILFEKFKGNFGYYPTSVGAWWIDSFSLDYMKQKYGITGNLGLADQFSTDGYKVWGTYWSTPFYPSKYHAGMPASDKSVKLDLVTLQWAPRDPLNGYYNSYFSTQDYLQSPVNQNTDYFKKILMLYAIRNSNSFGQIVVGLESDLGPDAYKNEFEKQMEVVNKIKNDYGVRVVSMSEFSDWYMKKFPDLTPISVIETTDLLGKPIKVIWYQSSYYRIGIVHNLESKETKIIDFRTYISDFQEPYYSTPNKELDLSIYIPSYFDEINNPEDVWKFEFGEMKSLTDISGKLEIQFEGGKIVFSEKKFVVFGKNIIVPKILKEASTLKVKENGLGIEIFPKSKWLVDREGYIFRDLTDVATHEVLRKKTMVLVLIFASGFLIISVLIFRLRISEKLKLLFLSLIITPTLLLLRYWYQENSMDYYVSQAEIDVLYRLSVLPKGRVLVYGKECLGCDWKTPQKPAVFTNKRSYVQKWGRHPIIYNSSVFEAENQQEAKSEFDKLNVAYIYVTKYGNYVEKVPFSPGDLNIEKIYDNANAEIWRVKGR